MASLTIKFRSMFFKPNLAKILVTQYRQSSFHASPFLVDLGNIDTKYEVTQSPEEWKYVERALPPIVVPTPIKKANYNSEWKPQTENVEKLAYYIPRTKNHMIPVYLKNTYRGIRRITVIRKVQGDIWLLEKEVRDFLQTQDIKPIRSQVNEFAGYIRFHGDHVNAIKYWLMQKNL